MKSKLEIVPIGRLQSKVVSTVRSLKGTGIYVSLNKSQKRMEKILKEKKIKVKKIFFIDCVESEKSDNDVLEISPRELENLAYAIKCFVDEIEGDKFLVIDALSVLLIYNNQNQVAGFVQKVTEYASRKNVVIVAFSPKTKEEELLNKIFNFFDEVKGK